MLGHHFRHDMIKKHVAMFGSLFNDLQIERFDSSDDSWDKLKIPLTYGPRDKLLALANQDFQSTKKAVSLTTPRISFELDDIHRDARRGTNPLMKFRIQSETKRIYTAIPIDFEFSVYVVAKNATDGNRIIEQILPFFQPSLTISMYVFGNEDPSISKDLKVVLNSVTCQDQYEGEEAARRSVLWTLRFTMHGFILGPVYAGGIIKKIEINNITGGGSGGDVEITESIIIRAGLTDAGEPTQDPDLSIPYDEIGSEDNWDFITQYESG